MKNAMTGQEYALMALILFFIFGMLALLMAHMRKATMKLSAEIDELETTAKNAWTKDELREAIGKLESTAGKCHGHGFGYRLHEISAVIDTKIEFIRREQRKKEESCLQS